MNEKQKKRLRTLFRVLSLAVTLGWLLFIFSNSLKSGAESGEQSSRVLMWVNSLAQNLGFRGEISESFIRKLAHFTEFALLGGFGCLSLFSFGVAWGETVTLRRVLPLFFSIPFCAICAGIDEWLQTFSEGRAAQISDVLIDTAGALTGTVVFIGALLLVGHLWKKDVKNNMM